MRIYVWKCRQVLAVLMGILLMTAMTSAGLTVLLLAAPEAGEEAVAAFAMEAEVMTEEQEEMIEVTSVVDESMTEVISDRTFRVEIIRNTPEPEPVKARILIYHSHTWEAYQQAEDDRYKETEKWRTKDERYNVVAVGDALAVQLRALGCSVVHDRTAYEPPDFEKAYARSLAMLEERASLGEEYDLYIDLHRDAIAANSTLKRSVNVGGTEIARFMMLIGKGTGAGFDVKPDWEANLKTAQALTDELNSMVEGICRDVKIKTGRFNQHVAPRCVLIECGNNLNTLDQVLAGIPYLAQAITNTMAQK